MGMDSLGAMCLLKLTEERVSSLSSLNSRAVGVVQGPACHLEIFFELDKLLTWRLLVLLNRVSLVMNVSITSSSSGLFLFDVVFAESKESLFTEEDSTFSTLNVDIGNGEVFEELLDAREHRAHNPLLLLGLEEADGAHSFGPCLPQSCLS